jgi:hypothetical protein
MKIHILDTGENPAAGNSVIVNCGKELNFDPIDAHWNDDRICEECRRLHVQTPNVAFRKTFAIPE